MKIPTIIPLENNYSCEFYDNQKEYEESYKFLKLSDLKISHNGEVLAIDDSFLCDLVKYNENYMFKDYIENTYSCYFSSSSFSSIADSRKYCIVFKNN